MSERSHNENNKKDVRSYLNASQALLWKLNLSAEDTSKGNRMNSSNLACLFAPNILHQMKSSSDQLSTSQMTTQAEETQDVANVVRLMIDNYQKIFEVRSTFLFKEVVFYIPITFFITIKLRKCNLCSHSDSS